MNKCIMDLFSKSSWIAVIIFLVFLLACLLPTVTVVAISILILGLIPLVQTLVVLTDTNIDQELD